jgi:hypothetical protein
VPGGSGRREERIHTGNGSIAVDQLYPRRTEIEASGDHIAGEIAPAPVGVDLEAVIACDIVRKFDGLDDELHRFIGNGTGIVCRLWNRRSVTEFIFRFGFERGLVTAAGD